MSRAKSPVQLSRTEILMPSTLKDRIKARLEPMGMRSFTDFIIHSCEKTLKTANKKKFGDNENTP